MPIQAPWQRRTPRRGRRGATGGGVELTFEGGPELERTMRLLAERVQKRIARRAVKEGAKVVVNAIQHRTPRLTGALRESMGIRVRGPGGKYKSAVAIVGPRAKWEKTTSRGTVKPSLYAHLVEQGTHPHPQKGFKQDGVYRSFPGGMHPGAEPNPFMERAFDANKRAALTVMISDLRKSLDRAVKRLAKKT